jgi:tRNA threonylcarbamoyladenosine biosynthesis protein TsaB
MPNNSKFLAFDTSTDVMSVALTDGERVWQHTGSGGAKASTTLIPAVLALLGEAGMALGDLRAIAFGRGPGAFSGLRTACAVAQGLAFGARHGAGIDVLPIDTLHALAEEARFQSPQDVQHITAMLDARMDEMYVQRYTCNSGEMRTDGRCELIRPENMPAASATDVPGGNVFAGNVFDVYADRLPAGLNKLVCLPTASAMLRLAPQLAGQGRCVKAALALPLYVRDKVALTTDERAEVSRAKLAASALVAAASAPPPSAF